MTDIEAPQESWVGRFFDKYGECKLSSGFYMPVEDWRDLQEFIHTELEAIRTQTVKECLEACDTPLRAGDQMPDDEIIEDTIQDAFVRQTIRFAIQDLLPSSETKETT